LKPGLDREQKQSRWRNEGSGTSGGRHAPHRTRVRQRALPLPTPQSLENPPRGERAGVRGTFRLEWQSGIWEGHRPGPQPEQGTGNREQRAGNERPLTPALSPCCVFTVRVVHGAREGWAASRVGLGTAAHTPLTLLTFQIEIKGHATFVTNVQTPPVDVRRRLELRHLQGWIGLQTHMKPLAK
jgi:hypothetical protein